jgi:hypothetical protein
MNPVTQNRRAAEHDRRDRRQQVSIAHRLRGLRRIAREQHAAKRGDATDGVDGNTAGLPVYKQLY